MDEADMGDAWRLRELKDVTFTVQLAGCVQPRTLDRWLWEASLVRFLLETPGSIEDWADMPPEQRMALVEAEVEHDTEERRAMVADAMQILRGEA